MNKYPVPGDDRLEILIKEAYDYMPGSEMARIYQLEERFGHYLRAEKPRSAMNKIPWWIVLLLTGGIATAAW